MPDTKITALTAIGANPIIPATFPIPMVDLTDTSMAASGTTKKVTVNQILGAGGTATLASATITGALTVQSNVNAPANVSLRYGPSAATWAGLRFDGTNQTFLDSDIGISFRTGGATSFTTAYTIGATGISTWYVGGSTAMTLNSTGLGVGVASPAQKVDVNGAMLATNVYLRSDDSDVSWGAGAGSRPIIRGNQTNNTIKFYTASTDRMTLDASGNVGIGVTPSAWAVNRKALQIGGLAAAALALNGTSNVSEMFFNSFINTSASNVYAVNGRAGLIDFGSGGFGFNIDSGTQTAGAACNFTRAMTLDASGNLILLSSNTPATLATNGQLTVNATSNTNLRFSYRGSDGVTRVANITLA